MNQPTRGPRQIEWGTVQDGEGHSVHDTHNPPGFSRIASVVFHEDSVGETRANVHLIAASPRMLEALKNLTALYASTPGHDPHFVRQGRAAIDQAEGRVPA
jgi:hypothetical protein